MKLQQFRIFSSALFLFFQIPCGGVHLITSGKADNCVGLARTPMTISTGLCSSLTPQPHALARVEITYQMAKVF